MPSKGKLVLVSDSPVLKYLFFTFASDKIFFYLFLWWNDLIMILIVCKQWALLPVPTLFDDHLLHKHCNSVIIVYSTIIAGSFPIRDIELNDLFHAYYHNFYCDQHGGLDCLKSECSWRNMKMNMMRGGTA